MAFTALSSDSKPLEFTFLLFFADGEPIAKATRNFSAESGTKGVNTGFSRLNAKRVKALGKKTFRTKQEISAGNDELVAQNHSKGVSRVFLSKELRETRQITEKEKHIEYSDISADSIPGLDKPHELFSKNTKPEDSFSRGSAARSQGWGDGGSIHKPRLKSPDFLKKRLTMRDGGDFFSRKTFRNLGCSEYMIKSLEGQLFLRPSHIQVC